MIKTKKSLVFSVWSVVLPGHVNTIYEIVKGNKMNNIWILARAESNETPTSTKSGQITSQKELATTQADSDPSRLGPKNTTKPLIPMWIFLPLGVFMLIMLFRGPRKQKQQRKRLIQSLKKNDRVQTIGGIIGTVVDVKDDEITLKVDESNNTKLKVASSAIGKNLSKDA